MLFFFNPNSFIPLSGVVSFHLPFVKQPSMYLQKGEMVVRPNSNDVDTTLYFWH